MDDRLLRIEQQLDTMQEAIVSLARVEERLISMLDRQLSIDGKVDELDKKIDVLATDMASSKVTERLIWLLIAAGVATVTTFLGG
tara:strand:+ start:385 stop:639 length:255 start_codon:yes stop_codon:yes gene_type:complete